MSTLTKNKKPNAFVRLTKHSEFTIGLVVIALFLLATFLTKNFFGSYNLKNLTKQGAIVGVLAVAQTFIIITSGIDISGGAIAGLGCMTMAMIMNCIPHVINARPGLKTMVDIPVPHAIMGDMRDMIEEDCKLVK